MTCCARSQAVASAGLSVTAGRGGTRRWRCENRSSRVTADRAFDAVRNPSGFPPGRPLRADRGAHLQRSRGWRSKRERWRPGSPVSVVNGQRPHLRLLRRCGTSAIVAFIRASTCPSQHKARPEQARRPQLRHSQRIRQFDPLDRVDVNASTTHEPPGGDAPEERKQAGDHQALDFFMVRVAERPESGNAFPQAGQVGSPVQ